MECHNKIQLKTGDIVPCGKCPICKANQRQEWVFRLRSEYYANAFSLFVTLTYDNEHCPYDMSVKKRDAQLFFKRLRKRLGSFRYYFISEYGDHTFRPHYHALLFFNSTFERKFICDAITDAWGLGFCSFGDVEEGSIVYCTKYCLKKNDVPLGRKENFRLVSKMNGGIGFNYLEKMSSYHRQTQNLNFVALNGLKCRMPKYYKDKLKGLIRLDFPHLDIELREHSISRSYSEHLEEFNKFVSTNKFPTLLDAQDAFNNYLRAKGVRENNLILKHTKKQKL